ncbi:MAG TPA: nickel-dependent hydrogenase large subunit [Kofleriaceae bacterium]|nr:nickel-dependent hydrogenase large subunit [Kofleriaceae bacterium]
MSYIVIDPVTRIEGHLRVEAHVADGFVTNAWSSSTMFRGIELILEGRDPRDAWAFCQRICGVCTTVHAIASIRAVEDAIGAVPPPNARILRNLIMAAQAVQDHVIHFYHLHALDWVDVVSALSADPAETSRLAQSISDWHDASATYFKGVKERLKGFVDRGQLGPFANAYWGHAAYKLPPAANLMAVAHYLAALDWQREFIKLHALLGGKNPHLQSFLVGGMATPIDPSSQAALNIQTIAALRELIAGARTFVNQVYIPDLLAIASFYKDWAGHGAGVGNYLVYGEYPLGDAPSAPKFLPAGVIRNRNLAIVEPFDPSKVTEQIHHSWYTYRDGDSTALHPSSGETRPHYTGPTPPFERLDTAAKYSWLKSPRYDGLAMEVGPLARMLVAYASGHAGVKSLVDSALDKLGVPLDALFSTLGRVAARGLETALLADKMGDWVDELAANMGRGELRIHDNDKWDPASWPTWASGAGFHEAPRGALGHWVHINHGRIDRYQCVVPSTWNAGPRDKDGAPGPYEAALVGTPVLDPEQPIEILRTVHSFDPCMACAVHVVDPAGAELSRVKVR